MLIHPVYFMAKKTNFASENRVFIYLTGKKQKNIKKILTSFNTLEQFLREILRKIL